MVKPAALPRSLPAWLSRQTAALAVSRRDDAVRRGRSAEMIRREVQSTILGVHIALPQTWIDEAVASVMKWRAIRLAAPPAEFLEAGLPRGALAQHLASKGITVGVLAGGVVRASVLATAAE